MGALLSRITPGFRPSQVCPKIFVGSECGIWNSYPVVNVCKGEKYVEVSDGGCGCPQELPAADNVVIGCCDLAQRSGAVALSRISLFESLEQRRQPQRGRLVYVSGQAWKSYPTEWCILVACLETSIKSLAPVHRKVCACKFPLFSTMQGRYTMHIASSRRHDWSN